jgi:hypothetical protein
MSDSDSSPETEFETVDGRTTIRSGREFEDQYRLDATEAASS